MMVGKYLGSVPAWFKFHMFCGVFGPIAVLYHANFSFGSLNSSVALLCMIVVASSGLVGRYFYSKIHYGLYGRKASLDELRGIIDSEEDQLSAAYKLIPEISEKLKEYHKQASMQVGVGESFRRFFTLGFKLRLSSLTLSAELYRALRVRGVEAGWSEQQTRKNYRILKKHLRSLLRSIIKTCEFSVYAFALSAVYYAGDLGYCACSCGSYVLAGVLARIYQLGFINAQTIFYSFCPEHAG